MREAGAVIELTSLFIGSSVARRAATAAGVRYLAMPGVRLETFRDDGPLAVDFDAIRGRRGARSATAWGGARRVPADHARRHRPARVGRGPARTRAARARARGRRVHGAARHRGGHGAGRGLDAPGSSSSTPTCCSWGEGPLPSPVVLHVADGAMVGLEGDEAGRLRGDARALRRRPDVEPGRGLDGVQPVGTRVRRRDGDRIGARHRAHRARQLDRLRRHRRRDRAPGLRDEGRDARARRASGDGGRGARA